MDRSFNLGGTPLKEEDRNFTLGGSSTPGGDRNFSLGGSSMPVGGDRDFSLGGMGGGERGFSLGGTILTDAERPPPPATHPNRAKDHNVRQLLEQAGKNSCILTLQGIKRIANVRDLQWLEDIGHGSCGTVTKCSYQDVIMAVKTMPRSSNSYEMSRILMDLDVINLSFDCPYIVRCFGYFITPTDVRVCMECMATCLDRLLERINRPIPEDIIGKMCVSIINALHYLKIRHQIMHRDVKPSNILLDWSGVVKLCDFGIAGRLIESRAHSKTAGCPLYMGPERLDPQNLNSYDIRSDVWSLGVTLVELATGKYPFGGSEFDMMTKIMREPPPLLDESKFSEDFCDIVKQCLQRDPNDRPNYIQLLQHPFIKYHETADTDVEEWFADVMAETEQSAIAQAAARAAAAAAAAATQALAGQAAAAEAAAEAAEAASTAATSSTRTASDSVSEPSNK